jgi:CRP-like cAMP-binding protein
VAKNIYWVEQGAIRSYYLKNGNEITTWFTFENEFITSFYSFISNAPSHETIELLEDSILYGLTFQDLNALTEAFPPINQLYRRVLEINFIKQEKKLAERFDTATEKYEDLIVNYPQILQRVPLGHIASYLGITQSTLSRIRRQ